MKKIGFILVGCGKVAKRHLDIIGESGELIAVCDKDETAAKNTANQYKVPFYASLYQLVEHHGCYCTGCFRIPGWTIHTAKRENL